MTTLLHIDDVPRDRDGAVIGSYVVRDASGALLEEVGERLIEGPELLRLEAAFCGRVTIAPADAATAEACARHVFEKTSDGARAKKLRALFRKPRPKKERGPKGPSRGSKTSGGSKAAATGA